jgi:putative ABC transport system permease protein
MWRATLQGLLARKLRLLLSATSIVFGVAFVVGALVLTASLSRTFDDLFATIDEGTDVLVRAEQAFDSGVASQFGDARPLVPQELVDTVAAVPGVRAVVGDVEGFAQVVDADGQVAVSEGGPPALGVNWVDDEVLSSLSLREGRAPTGPAEAALDAGSAASTGYQVGDTMGVVTQQGPGEFELVGVFGFGEADNLAGASVVAFAEPTARDLLMTDDGFLVLRAAGEQGVSQDELAEAVAAALPAGFEARTGEQSAAQNSDDVKEALGFFSTFLLVFATAALFVGAFLIFNTFSMLVAQRQRELALLRALGAGRGQVVRSVLAEAGAVGLLASAVGLGLGVLVAVGLRAAFGVAGIDLPPGDTVVGVGTVVAAFTIGVGVTCVAALLPARKASSVPPIAAMRDASVADGSLHRITAAGLVLLLLGGAAFGVGLVQGQLPLLGAGAVVAFLGAAALSPVVSRPVAGSIARLVGRGLPGRLGRENTTRNPRRTAATASALMVGMALVAAVGVLAASLRASIEVVVDQALGADLIVTSQGFTGMSPEVARQLRGTDGLGRVDQVKVDAAQVVDRVSSVMVVDPGAIGTSLLLRESDGDVAALGPGRVLLSEPEAEALDVTVGDTVPVRLARGDGPVTHEVAGLYEANQFLAPVMLDDSLVGQLSAPLDFFVLVTAADAGQVEAGRSAVLAAAGDYPGLMVQDRDEFLGTQDDQVAGLQAVVGLLLALSVLIAVLGIVNTLALSVTERTREFGLLRAIGLSRRQVRQMVRTESVAIAAFGGLLGITVGVALGAALRAGLASEGLVELRVPAGELALYLLLSAAAGVLAAVLPARRASRLDVLEAISTE